MENRVIVELASGTRNVLGQLHVKSEAYYFDKLTIIDIGDSRQYRVHCSDIFNTDTGDIQKAYGEYRFMESGIDKVVLS